MLAQLLDQDLDIILLKKNSIFFFFRLTKNKIKSLWINNCCRIAPQQNEGPIFLNDLQVWTPFLLVPAGPGPEHVSRPDPRCLLNVPACSALCLWRLDRGTLRRRLLLRLPLNPRVVLSEQPFFLIFRPRIASITASLYLNVSVNETKTNLKQCRSAFCFFGWLYVPLYTFKTVQKKLAKKMTWAIMLLG